MLNSKRNGTMLGKDAILHFFERKGIRNLFHLPGIHALPLNESFVRHPNTRVIHGRHEANLAFMADGYARASDEPGVLIVTPGPGLGNVVTGCMEAFSDDVPLLIIHIDTGRDKIGKGILHELREPEAIFARFTKKILAVSRKEDLIPFLDQGYKAVTTDRRGPVVVSIPHRFLEKETPFVVEEERETKIREIDFAGIEGALEGKKRPVIIGGKSLMKEDLAASLENICKTSNIPFLTTTAGKGVMSETLPWAFGNVMQKGTAKKIVSSADIVIAIGTRLRDIDVRRGVKIRDLIHIDIDDSWIGKNYPVQLSASGDLMSSLEGLREILKSRRFEWSLPDLKRDQDEERSSLERSSPGFRAMKLIRDNIPEDAVTLWDLCLIGYWAELYFPVVSQRSFIMPLGISPIFYAFPAALGAKLGKPDRPCLCVTGDGSFLPCLGELATIKKYNIPVVILVHNNRSFGVLEDYMRASYGIDGSMPLTNPDFVEIAKAFDVRAKKAETPDQLKAIFQKEIRWDEPFLIELDCPVLSPPWRQ